MVSVSRTQLRSLPATARSSSSPTGCPSVSLTFLNWSRSRQSTASRWPRSTWASASLRHSRSSMRFGSSVSASWRAIWAIFISARRRSVMSSWVATHPPPAIGWLTTSMVRPSPCSTNWLVGWPCSIVARGYRHLFRSRSLVKVQHDPQGAGSAREAYSRACSRPHRACTYPYSVGCG